MTVDNKVHLNHLGIILGTKCNLKCSHCLGGNPKQHMVIQEKYIDDLILNLSGINQLSFLGYETTLYINEMIMIFEKLINSHIRINSFSVCTNAVQYSQKLVDFIKRYQNYVTNPKNVLIHFSYDSYHYNNGFTQKECSANIKKYLNNLGDGYIYNIQKFDTEELVIQGRAKELNFNQLSNIKKIEIPIDNNNYNIRLVEKCEDEKNICSISNCIVSAIILIPNGYIFVGDTLAFNAIALDDYSQSIGHICYNSLYNMIINHNSNYNEIQDSTQRIVFRNDNSLNWNINNLLYHYLICVQKMIKATNNNNGLDYNTIKNDLIRKVAKIEQRFYKNLYESKIEYENEAKQLYNLIKKDFNTLIGILDSYFLFPFFKSTWLKQIEIYNNNSAFKKEKFKEMMGIDFDLFMELWDSYYKCDYDKYKSITRIIKDSKKEINN